jgi:hypothetical protein
MLLLLWEIAIYLWLRLFHAFDRRLIYMKADAFDIKGKGGK